jgi:uncharacterized membrane protein
MVYLGFDVHERLSRAHKETTVSKSMVVVGIMFSLFAAYHTYEDLPGESAPLEIHLVPIAVLVYALYEYRRLIQEASSVSLG